MVADATLIEEKDRAEVAALLTGPLDIPESQIIAETRSTNTEESAARLAAIARENHLNRILAVSDGTHLFRIHALSASMGLNVVTSPRPEARPLGFWDSARRLMHEMFSYTLWRVTR